MGMAFCKIYYDFEERAADLPEDARARLLLALLRYAKTGERPAMDGPEKYLFSNFAIDIDRDKKTYESKVANGSKPKEANQSESKRIEANRSESKRISDTSSETPYDTEDTEDTQDTEDMKNKDQGQGNHARASALDRRFAAFWAAYPKKVGKQDALRAFARLKVGEGQLAAMLAAIEQQRASPQWAKDGGQYIPNPATWLRQGRWEDEPLSASPPQSDAARLLAMAERYAEMGV